MLFDIKLFLNFAFNKHLLNKIEVSIIVAIVIIICLSIKKNKFNKNDLVNFRSVYLRSLFEGT